MMTMLKFTVSLLISLQAGHAFASNYHKVSKNECLSCIAEMQIGLPVYGKEGSLEFLLELNQGLADRNFIEINDEIKLPSKSGIRRFTQTNTQNPSGYCVAGSGGAYRRKNKSYENAGEHARPVTKGSTDISPEGPMNVISDYSKKENNKSKHEYTFKDEQPRVPYRETKEYRERKQRERLKKRYFVGLGVYNSVIEAVDQGTGALAEWVSTENYSLGGAYQVKWGKFWFGAELNYHIQDYKVELSPIFTWDEKVPSLFKFSLISDYEWERIALGFNLNFDQVSFFYENGSVVELRGILMPGVSLRAKYKWYDTFKWSSRLGVEFSYPLFGSDEISPKGEFGYQVFIDFKKHELLWGHDISAQLYYGKDGYTNDQNDQTDEVAGIILGISTPSWF